MGVAANGCPVERPVELGVGGPGGGAQRRATAAGQVEGEVVKAAVLGGPGDVSRVREAHGSARGED